MVELNLLLLSILTISIPKFRNIFFNKGKANKKVEIKSRLDFFDLIKGLALIFVIVIHAVELFTSYIGVEHDFFFIFLNNTARFAVPLFFICSGILLNPIKDKKELPNFYKKKIIRVFIPYFSLLFLLTFGRSIKEFSYYVLTGRFDWHFYFIIVFFQMYLIYPILDKFRNKNLFLPFSFLFSVLFFIFEKNIDFVFAGRFLFFFAYGMHMRSYFINYKKNKEDLKFWLLILFLYFIIFFYNHDIYTNSRFFYSLAVFNILFYYKEQILKMDFLKKILIPIGRNGIWFFLVHLYVIYEIYQLLELVNLHVYIKVFLVISFGSFFTAIISTVIGRWYNKLIKHWL